MFEKNNISRKQSILVILIIIAMVLYIYWPVQDYGFIYFDDDVYVTQNIHLQSGITTDGLRWAFTTTYFGLWNPLTWLSLMLDYRIFGLNAGGYHWTNVILHILNAVLLFFLLRILTGAEWRSAFVAALFAVHPINVESVAWIAERKNVLSTFFWMTTMLCYVWYAKRPGWKRYVPVLISFAMGLMSKPMLVTLPFVLLLIDYWPLNRTAIAIEETTGHPLNLKKEKISFLIMEKIPLFILSAIVIFLTIGAPRTDQTIYTTFAWRMGNVVFSYVAYLKNLFSPLDLHVYYLSLSVPFWKLFACAVFLIFVTIFVCRYFKRHPYLPVGWFWYLGTFVPVIGFIQIADHTMADRYAYVPFIGIFMMIAWGGEKVFPKTVFLKKILIVLFILIIIFFAVTSRNQIKIWENTVTLFNHVIEKDPKNHLAYQVIGQEMAKRGEHEKALTYFDTALKIHPQFFPAYSNKALVLKKMGKHDEAMKNFETAGRLNKNSPELFYNLSFIYLEEGNYEESLQYALKAIRIKPDYEEAYNIAGIASVEAGKIKEGIDYFQKSLRINPRNLHAQRNLKITLEKNKNRHER
ncbi:MAG TPA: tetratricopeptide repeat protein [Smithella sp.]|jgi:tetratricopeptide (TPR) repeat protein|nr:tetratricopeptide repeat protein [Smithella sp.]HNQ66492.1 tetratricopeptide repeat protein [Smithella sp.]HOS13989.1 tetratricopeptide repeat protein [Smithella sp.]HPL47676.1 tetratricopeptide repeat protein [Smithella sp.]HPV51942.1 tetratricopeptide repeat protein [Smithella sp.]